MATARKERGIHFLIVLFVVAIVVGYTRPWAIGRHNEPGVHNTPYNYYRYGSIRPTVYCP